MRKQYYGRPKKRRRGITWLALFAAVVIAACATGFWYMQKQQRLDAAAAQNQSTRRATTESSKTTQDLTKLPLGDGKVSTAPQKGMIMSCQKLVAPKGSTVAANERWIIGNSWNLEAKPTVDGNISWEGATFSAVQKGSDRVITGNGLPLKTGTGLFPVAKTSVAYVFDKTSTAILPQQIFYNLPLSPQHASAAGCVPTGVIGYLTNGVALYSALDASGRDLAAHEMLDSCDGRPDKTGAYHYYALSRCLEKTIGNNKLVGYAMDGFGIFGNKDAKGNILTSADLDECHGITSPIQWDNKTVTMYHYVLTHDYPYAIGCFRGTSVKPVNPTPTPTSTPRIY